MLLQPLELPPAPEKVVLKVLKDTLSKVEVTRGADGWPSFRDLAIHLLTTDVAVVGKPTGLKAKIQSQRERFEHRFP